MRPPAHIDVGPHRFEVRSDAETGRLLREEDANGDSRPCRLVIRIDPDRPHSAVADTLLHELLHCCWWTVAIGADDDKPSEETVVAALSTALLDALRRNPSLVAFLTRNPEAL